MINDRKLQMYKINKITLCNDYLINVIDYRSFHSIPLTIHSSTNPHRDELINLSNSIQK